MSSNGRTEPAVPAEQADIRRRVREFLTSTFFVMATGDITDETSLLEAGIIDSTGVLEVIGFLEATFGFHVNDDEIAPDNLGTVDHMVRYVLTKTTPNKTELRRPTTVRPLEPIKVSVVIPTYNYARFLATAVESALNQTYRNLEIVVVDDGSTDDTPAVMQPFLDNPRVRYIRQENRGASAARNVGIRESDGPLVAFLDADDIWEATKLEKQAPCFANPIIGVVYSAVTLIDEAGRALPTAPAGGYLAPRSGKVTGWLVFDNFVPFSSSVVRRECLKIAGVCDESLRMGMDWDLWLRISLTCEFQSIGEPLVRYRMGHSDQLSRQTERRFESADRITSHFYARSPDVVSPAVRRAARAYTCAVRGDFYRRSDWPRSTLLFLEAARQNWRFRPAYRGLVRNLLVPVLGR
jgi:glycosyltransferase involved in cell wall biosynthesis/acyl carrier protein